MSLEDPGQASFAGIGGLGDQVRELREVIELPLMNPELFEVGPATYHNPFTRTAHHTGSSIDEVPLGGGRRMLPRDGPVQLVRDQHS